MALNKDAGVNNVDQNNAGVVNFGEETVQQKVKVFPTGWSCIVEVVNSHTKVVTDIGFQI